MAQSEDCFVLCSSEVDHAGVMPDVTRERIPLNVGAVLPLSSVRGARSRHSEIIVFDLVLKGEAFVHKLL